MLPNKRCWDGPYMCFWKTHPLSNSATATCPNFVGVRSGGLVQSCLWFSCDPMDCSPPGSAGHGISQARILEWVAILSVGNYLFFCALDILTFIFYIRQLCYRILWCFCSWNVCGTYCKQSVSESNFDYHCHHCYFFINQTQVSVYCSGTFWDTCLPLFFLFS